MDQTAEERNRWPTAKDHWLTGPNPLVVATHVTHPGYTAEWDAAVEMLATLEPRARRRTLGAAKGYDQPDFVAAVRALRQRKRKLVEQGFGWSKVIGLLRKLRHRGLERVGWIVGFTNAAYNLVRLRSLIGHGVCP